MSATPIPLSRGLKLANLVSWAYEMLDHPQIPPPSGVAYSAAILLSVDDLADDGLAFKDDVVMGFIGTANAPGGDDELVVAIRGTSNGFEWFKDFEVAGMSWAKHEGLTVEKGFQDLYNSLGVWRGADTDTALLEIQKLDPAAITICGHSLGSAIATLLAYDVARTLPNTTVTLVTLASPCVGTPEFATSFNALTNLDAYRLHVKGDVVVGALTWIGYEHVGFSQEFLPTGFKSNWACVHIISSYQFILSGGTDKSLLSSGCR